MCAESWDPDLNHKAQEMLDDANRYEQMLYMSDLLHELQTLGLAAKEPKLAGLISQALAEALIRIAELDRDAAA